MRGAVEYASKYFRGKEDLTIAEVGVEKGEHALEIYNTLKPKQLYLVDAYEERDGDKHFEEAKSKFMGVEGVQFVKDWSHRAVNYVPHDLDFVCIDAGHWEQQILFDIACWFPKVRDGGIIAGHDIKLADVQQGVTRMFSWEYFFKGDDWWYVKIDKKYPTFLGKSYPFIKGTLGWLYFIDGDGNDISK